MPQPRNNILHTFYKKNLNLQVVCTRGNCNGRVLNKHGANLERHLRLIHPDSYAIYMKQKESSRQDNITDKAELNPYKPVDRYNTELAIVEFFTKNAQSLEMLEDRAFRLLLEPAFNALNYVVTAQCIKERIEEFSRKLKTEIATSLNGKMVSLLIDEATKQDLTLLAITVQYTQGKRIVFKTLAIKQLKPSNATDEKIQSIVLDVLKAYSIDTNQVLTITSNSGANMQNILNDGSIDLNSCAAAEDSEYGFIEESLQPISANVSLYDVVRVRCGAHTLQLCVLDVLEMADIQAKIERCRHVSKQLSTLSYLDKLKRGGFKAPVNDCSTNWQSTFIMIERLVEIKNAILALSAENPDILISNDIWDFIGHFLFTFRPVFKAMKKLQSQSQMCFSELYVVLMELLCVVENLPENEMTRLLVDALNIRKSQLFDNEDLKATLLWDSNILFNAAVYLDPRIRVCLTSEQVARAKQCIIYLYKRISSFRDGTAGSYSPNSSLVVASSKNEPSTSGFVGKTPKKFAELLEKLDPVTNEQTLSTPPSHLETDIMIYDRQARLPLNTNIVEFWSTSNSTLATVANIILAIPIAQVNVTRLLTALDYILSDQPNRLNSFHLAHVLFIKFNAVFNYKN